MNASVVVLHSSRVAGSAFYRLQLCFMRYLRCIAMTHGAFENAMNGFFEMLLLDLQRYGFTVPKFLQPFRTVAAEANVLCDRLRG